MIHWLPARLPPSAGTASSIENPVRTASKVGARWADNALIAVQKASNEPYAHFDPLTTPAQRLIRRLSGQASAEARPRPTGRRAIDGSRHGPPMARTGLEAVGRTGF